MLLAFPSTSLYLGIWLLVIKQAFYHPGPWPSLPSLRLSTDMVGAVVFFIKQGKLQNHLAGTKLACT
jgi:hypothetical protein